MVFLLSWIIIGFILAMGFLVYELQIENDYPEFVWFACLLIFLGGWVSVIFLMYLVYKTVFYLRR